MFRPLIFGTAIALGTMSGVSAETFEVKMLNKGENGRMVFEPSALQIAPGDTVKFLATSKGHNAELIKGMAPEGAASFKGKINQEIEVTLETEGLYGVMGKPHYAMGMTLTIKVGDDAPNAESFLEGRIPKKAMARFETQLASF